ncbi:hypothetical protein [Borrelia sp. RT5S]|uniref:hypothetical protein n=1 Tax=Borrelia sp. RT5S TaxID=2898581 RepID=UPI001E58FCA6|nr:hypothetical protein [Borrelia sp. RT5S]UGQ16781.1 hypothetical protein LSO06_05520 [Borrelia sp. RT5S]
MVKVVCILFLLLLNLNLFATVPPRPFNFKSWNFQQDVEDAYGLSYEYKEGALLKAADATRQRRADRILKRITEIENYYESLFSFITDNLFFKVEAEFLRKGNQHSDDDIFIEVDNRMQDIIEIPMEKRLGKERYRLLNFSNKNLIESPDYTKLFINVQIQEIEFLENYITRRLGINLSIPADNAVRARPAGSVRPAGNGRPISNQRPASRSRTLGNGRPTVNRRPASRARPTVNQRPNGNARPAGSSRPTVNQRPVQKDKLEEEDKPESNTKPVEYKRPAGGREAL